MDILRIILLLSVILIALITFIYDEYKTWYLHSQNWVKIKCSRPQELVDSGYFKKSKIIVHYDCVYAKVGKYDRKDR